jgi:thiol-disulfide isomerase/thioredoxin
VTRCRSAFLGVVLALGCQNDGEPAPVVPKSRSVAVQAAAPAPSVAVAASAPLASAGVAAPATLPKRELCAERLGGSGRPFPARALSRAGNPPLAPALKTGAGAWTWINFWAAWCVPCREEIPRLRSWESRLRDAQPSLRLVFVSMDDDERQLRDFLAAQPEGGLRSTYWLRDGKEREEWMAEAGLEVDPELPAHLLVDPAGRIRCVVKGAVEDADFPLVEKIVGG